MMENKKGILIIVFCLNLFSPLFAEGSVDYIDNDLLSTFAYSHNDKYIAVAEIGGTIKIYDSVTLDIINIIQGHKNIVNQIEFSPDNMYMASCSDDIIINEINTGKIIFHITPQSYITTSISYRFDGQRLVSGGSTGLISVWDTVNGIELMTLDGSPYEVIKTISYSPDGSRIMSAFENCLKIWDANKGIELKTISEQNMWTLSATYSVDGTKIIVGYSNKLMPLETIIKIYDSNNYDILKSFTIGKGSFRNTFISSDNIHIIFDFNYISKIQGQTYNQIIIMDSTSGNIMKIINHANGFSNVRFPFAINYGGNIVYTANGKDIAIESTK